MKNISSKTNKEELNWGQATVDALNRAKHPVPMYPGRDYHKEHEEMMKESDESK